MTASPDLAEYKDVLATHLENLGEQFVDLGRVAEALPHYRRAVEIRRQLLRSHQGSRQYAVSLAEGLLNLGEIQRHDGGSAAARESFDQARQALEPAAAAAPGDADLQGRLGAVLTSEAVAEADLRGAAAALDRLRRAVQILRPLGSTPSANGRQREWLAEALWQLARLVQAVHQSAESDRLDAERAAVWKDRPPGELAALALQRASRAALIGYGKTPVSDRARLVRQLDLDQAAANLRLAVSQGFTDLQMIQAHPDAWLLRSRDDLKLLLLDLAFPRWPFDPSR